MYFYAFFHVYCRTVDCIGLVSEARSARLFFRLVKVSNHSLGSRSYGIVNLSIQRLAPLMMQPSTKEVILRIVLGLSGGEP